MASKRKDGLEGRLGFFSRKLPSSRILFALLLLFSLSVGIASVALIGYKTPGNSASDFLIKGSLTGILLFVMPTLITVLTIKLLKRVAMIKHLIAIAFVASAVYGIFFILGSAIYALTANQAIFILIILLGDASIFAWWFMVSKIALGRRKSASLYALLQPSLNLLLFAPFSGFLLSFFAPLNLLLVKLYASIAIFAVISYLVLFIFDSPIKRSMGIDGVAVFSQMVQGWLFNIDATLEESSKGKFGVKQDIDIDTIVIRTKKGKLKGVLFSPWIHYGPAGVIGGSNFPYMLERHTWNKHGVPGIIIHPALNEDLNPIIDSQISELKEVLDKSIANSEKISSTGFSYLEGKHNAARVGCIAIGNICITTFSRAPKVTEDMAPEAGILLKKLLEQDGRMHLLVDAHNSRYETASKAELMGVQPNSIYMNDYVEAIKSLKRLHQGKVVHMGLGFSNPYNELNSPHDLAPGNINVLLFRQNGFARAMIFFNANNMMPSVRDTIIKHVRRKFSIESEVYTTDTHFVNALNRTASNVLGRYTEAEKLLPFIDKAVETAILNTEPVEIYHKRTVLKNFAVWGANVRERMNAVVSSVFGLARIAVPLLIAVGFVIAAWLITVI